MSGIKIPLILERGAKESLKPLHTATEADVSWRRGINSPTTTPPTQVLPPGTWGPNAGKVKIVLPRKVSDSLQDFARTISIYEEGGHLPADLERDGWAIKNR